VTDPMYTRSDVSAALSAGADVILDELDSGERDRDLITLIINAAMSCLDNPHEETSFDQVAYDTNVEHPDSVRAWWSHSS
jgi:hypothetical protein